MLLSMLLYLPPIQDFAVGKAAETASRATKLEISAGRIRLGFPLRLEIKNVTVIDPQARDTLLDAGTLTVRADLLPLLRKTLRIRELSLRSITANSAGLIETLGIEGTIGTFSLQGEVDLGTNAVTVQKIALLRTSVALRMGEQTPDTIPADTTPLSWSFRVNELTLDSVAFAMETPADSFRFSAFVGEGSVRNALVDLGAESYGAERLELSGSRIAYDKGARNMAAYGFDPAHILLSDVALRIDSATVAPKGASRADIRRLSFRESAGIKADISGSLRADTLSADIPELKITTPASSLRLTAFVPWSALAQRASEELELTLGGTVGKNDLIPFLPQLAKPYPALPLLLEASVAGNMDDLRLDRLQLRMPGVARFSANGKALRLRDSLDRTGELSFELLGGDLSVLGPLLPDSISLPNDLTLRNRSTMAGMRYATQLTLTDGPATLEADASFDAATLRYRAAVTAHELDIARFMHYDSIGFFSAGIRAEGAGLDFFSPRTEGRVEGSVTQLEYRGNELAPIRFNGALAQSDIRFALRSDSPDLQLEAGLNGNLNRTNTTMEFSLISPKTDLHRLGFAPSPLSLTFALGVTASSDLKERHAAVVRIDSARVVLPGTSYRMGPLKLEAGTAPEKCYARADGMGISLSAEGEEDAAKLGEAWKLFMERLSGQLNARKLDETELRKAMPRAQLSLTIVNAPEIRKMLDAYSVGFSALTGAFTTSPEEGINGQMLLTGAVFKTFPLDTLSFRIRQDTTGLRFRTLLANDSIPSFPFRAMLEGSLQEGRATLMTRYFDGTGKEGVRVGAEVQLEADSSLLVHLIPASPIIGFRRFALNPDNFIRLNPDRTLLGNVLLRDSLGTEGIFRGETEPEGNRAELDINRLILSDFTSMFPFLPDISGYLSVQAEYLRTGQQKFSLAGSIHAEEFSYEKQPVGDILLTATLDPTRAAGNPMESRISLNKKESILLKGTYNADPEAPHEIDGEVTLNAVPLWPANLFVPDQLATLQGTMTGSLQLRTKGKTFDTDGSLRFDSTQVDLPAYGAHFRMTDEPLTVTNNKLNFSKYNIYASGNNPFTIDGWVDYSDLNEITTNLSLNTRNYHLLSGKRSKNSVVYGNVYVDINSTVKGPLSALDIRGNVNLLGNTDVTYVMQESALAVQDRLGNTVTFESFADTTDVQAPPPPPLAMGGLNMLMTVNINPQLRMNVDLTPDQQSKVSLQGGGSLALQYTPQGDMLLSGRYTLTGGTLQYKLPVIPAKTFSITNGSYVEWTGNIADPNLNITAVEEVRTSVTQENNKTRMVTFNISIALKNRLDNLSVVFDLSAPEDMAIQNELAALTAEQRSQEAIKMLATGTYSGSGNAQKPINVSGTLNNFLQNQLEKVTKGALKSIDINFGMDTYQDGEEGTRTDYNFQFTKRFYNDRIRIVIGGQVSTEGSNDHVANNQSFIDNISFEYSLDDSNTRYIKVFYDKNFESVLEGEVTEMGVGLVLQRKVAKLRDLFVFKRSPERKAEIAAKREERKQKRDRKKNGKTEATPTEEKEE